MSHCQVKMRTWNYTILSCSLQKMFPEHSNHKSYEDIGFKAKRCCWWFRYYFCGKCVKTFCNAAKRSLIVMLTLLKWEIFVFLPLLFPLRMKGARLLSPAAPVASLQRRQSIFFFLSICRTEAGLIIKLVIHKDRAMTDDVIKNLKVLLLFTRTHRRSEFSFRRLYVKLLQFFTTM